MKFKRIFSIVIVLTLVFSLSFTTVFADGWKNGVPPGLAKKGGLPPGIAKKIFDDIDDTPWAENYIEKMYLKGLIQGYGNGIFKPKEAVTKLESIILALRVMGWEDDAKNINNLPKKYKGKKVDDWAIGYVALAYEKGILDDVDLMYFNPKEPVKRHEVAKYIIRALGYEDEAEDYMDEKLPFKDAAAVPQGSVGYVYLVNKMELMTGDNLKRFNPMGTMTRAEMAVLIARVDDKVDSDIDDSEVVGEIYRIDDDTIVLTIDGEREYFDVDRRVRVYDENRRIDYDDLKVGLKVRMEIEDDEVVYIEVIDSDDTDKIISRYSGEVERIEYNPKKIAIKSKTMILIFEVIRDVDVRFENGRGDFEDVEKGDEVTVVVDKNNRVRTIYVDRDEEEDDDWDEVEGILVDIDDDEIEVKVNSRRYTYELDRYVDVEIDGDEARLSDLIEGMEVRLEIVDGEVVLIEAESIEFEFYGEIKEIYRDELTIEKRNGDEVTYEVSEDVDIDIEGIRRPDFYDLEEGDYGKFEVENNVIVKIEIENEIEEVEGILVSVNKDEIEIRVDGETEEYDLSEDVKIEIDGYSDALKYLQEGMKVEVKIRNNEVYEIYAEDNEFEIEGEIDAITKTSNGVKIAIESDDDDDDDDDRDDERYYEYYLAEDVEIEIEDVRNPDVDDLKVGQEGEFEIVNNLIIKIEIDD